MKRFVLFFIIFVFFNTSFTYAATYSGSLPVMFIQTENNAPIVSKDDYINATYYIDALGLDGYNNIGSADSLLTMEIKGRGNWTWKAFDKKPYRIKLSEKQPLMGMKKSKHFALLAHADDSKGFMRNAVGFELSRMMGMAWTPTAYPIEVVLNGDYIGLYFLTETIRVDADRIDIVEQEDEETDASKISGGWLVEIDNYDEDPNIKITEGDGARIIFTYKTPEVLSSAQEAFLKDEMTRINELVYGDKNSEEIWQYLDIDALARFYIVQEIVDNYESFHGSCYLYRDLGDNQKWKFGPVWDFGSSFNYSKSQYIYQGREHHMTWIGEICKFPVFMQYVKELWKEFYASQYAHIYDYTASQLSLLQSAAAADLKRWPQYGNDNLANRINHVNMLLRTSGEWLDEQWAEGSTPPNDSIWEDDLAVTVMYVWQNGKPVEYSLDRIDSITFARKEGIVVKAKVPDTWKDDIYVWIWGDGISTNEFMAKKQGEWYYFSHLGKELNIIFKNGKGWSGHPNQTEDIYTTKSACYLIEQSGEEKATATATNCP